MCLSYYFVEPDTGTGIRIPRWMAPSQRSIQVPVEGHVHIDGFTFCSSIGTSDLGIAVERIVGGQGNRVRIAPGPVSCNYPCSVGSVTFRIIGFVVPCVFDILTNEAHHG